MIHPFAPADQAHWAIKELIDDLSPSSVTSPAMTAISMQPNSGAQGEYAGLLTIAAYHRAIGRGRHRNICLIPMSAHGTNPASAQMVRLEVVVVKSAERMATSTSTISAPRRRQHSKTSPAA